MSLQGKVLNSERNSLHKLLNNKEISNMIRAIGCGIGKEFDYSKLRYNKIIIMTDADVDGSHIRILLLTFFYNYMPELLYNGNIYIALAPLYKVTMDKKIYYLLDDSELESFKRKHPNKELTINYLKGLGELDPHELGVSTLDPSHRRLKQVIIKSKEQAKKTIQELMGSAVAPRREFIENNSYRAKIDI